MRGCHEKGVGMLVQDPPVQAIRLYIDLTPDVSLSGHHISTSQEQSDKDILNSYLGQS